MKAKTLVFTLLIGLMCFAGFGSTTSDPTENSTNQTIVDDHDAVSVTVVISTSQEVVKKDTSINFEVSTQDFFETSESQQFEVNAITLEAQPKPPSWCNGLTELNMHNIIKAKVKDSHEIIYPNTYLRNPRDGLNFFHV